MKKRALLYLSRKYTRTVLLFILLCIISISLAIGLSVRRSIGAVVMNVQQTLGTSFILKERMDENLFERHVLPSGQIGTVYVGPTVNQALIDDIMTIDGVTEYNAEASMPAYVEGTQLIEGLYAEFVHMEIEDPGFLAGYHLTLDGEKMWAGTTNVQGNTNTQLYDKFRSGAFSLVEGRHITSDDKRKALISDEVARLNSFRIGDTIALSQNELLLVGGSEKKLVGDPITLEVVGIFHVNGYQDINEYTSEQDIISNWILTDLDTIAFQNTQSEYIFSQEAQTIHFDNATFFVDDPASLQSIIKQAEQLGSIGTYYYDLSVDDSGYRSTVEPLNSIKLLVTISVLVIVIGCVFVLCLVFTMWVKSRKREMGIYLSMGIKKTAIIGQLVLEALVVAALAFVLTFAVTRSVPNVIGNKLLSISTAEQAPQPQEYSAEQVYESVYNGTADELSAFQTGYTGPEQIDFVFRPMDWLLLALLEVLIILGTICKAGTFLFKLQPKQILSDMS